MKQPSTEPKQKFGYSRIGVEEGKQQEFRTAILEAAKAEVDAFPETLSKVTEQLKAGDPIGIIATFASYGLHTIVDSERGLDDKRAFKDIEQHHVELLQALALSIPEAEWPHAPFTPDQIQKVADTLPDVAMSFLHERILAADGVEDNEQLTLLSLQERVRLHTQAVRNWGYFSEVVRISNDIYSTLDDKFRDHFGFKATELIQIMKAIVAELERRTNDHWQTLAKVVTERTPTDIAKAYYREVPDLQGNAEDILNALPDNITAEGMMSIVMAHFDLRLRSNVRFDAAEVSALVDLDDDLIEKALSAIALSPGSLVDTPTEHLFLGNPVWDAPVIKFDDAFFVAMPQMFFSHIQRIMERLADEAGLKQKLESRRAEYLESELHRIFANRVPKAQLIQAASWKLGDQQFETDLLVMVDRTVLIVEAKSNRLTASGLRGAPDRVKRHVNDLVVYPSIQSARLEEIIQKAQTGDQEAQAIAETLGIVPNDVDQVIRVSVTLDDFSVLSSAEDDLRELGWMPPHHQLAPTILLSDLVCIFDILESDIALLHYLSERKYLQKSFALLGDELDFLGLYLETGFNIAGLRDEGDLFSVSGMSGAIDRYYNSKDAGMEAPKPKVNLSRLYSEILEKLANSQTPGWITAGMHLLSSADFDEQKKIKVKLSKLRGKVRKNYKNPNHINSLFVKPPESRKAIVAFFLFPEELRHTHKSTMEKLALQMLNDYPGIHTAVIFGRSIDVWKLPYEALAIIRQLPDAD